jgi:hypothetical protein
VGGCGGGSGSREGPEPDWELRKAIWQGSLDALEAGLAVDPSARAEVVANHLRMALHPRTLDPTTRSSHCYAHAWDDVRALLVAGQVDRLDKLQRLHDEWGRTIKASSCPASRYAQARVLSAFAATLESVGAAAGAARLWRLSCDAGDQGTCGKRPDGALAPVRLSADAPGVLADVPIEGGAPLYIRVSPDTITVDGKVVTAPSAASAELLMEHLKRQLASFDDMARRRRQKPPPRHVVVALDRRTDADASAALLGALGGLNARITFRCASQVGEPVYTESTQVVLAALRGR